MEKGRQPHPLNAMENFLLKKPPNDLKTLHCSPQFFHFKKYVSAIKKYFAISHNPISYKHFDENHIPQKIAL